MCDNPLGLNRVPMAAHKLLCSQQVAGRQRRLAKLKMQTAAEINAGLPASNTSVASVSTQETPTCRMKGPVADVPILIPRAAGAWQGEKASVREVPKRVEYSRRPGKDLAGHLSCTLKGAVGSADAHQIGMAVCAERVRPTPRILAQSVRSKRPKYWCSRYAPAIS